MYRQDCARRWGIPITVGLNPLHGERDKQPIRVICDYQDRIVTNKSEIQTTNEIFRRIDRRLRGNRVFLNELPQIELDTVRYKVALEEYQRYVREHAPERAEE